MIKRLLYLNLTYYCIFCILIISLAGCTKPKKAEIKKKTPEKVADAGRALIPAHKRDFPALLGKLKKKNPFNKDHTDIYKYKFASGALILSGIFYDEKRPLAIVNNRVVTEGDMVDDKRVIRITQDEVVLKDKEKEYHLKTE